MRVPSLILYPLSTLLWRAEVVRAFASHPPNAFISRRQLTTRIGAVGGGSLLDDQSDSFSSFDLEAARRHLESILKSSLSAAEDRTNDATVSSTGMETSSSSSSTTTATLQRFSSSSDDHESDASGFPSVQVRSTSPSSSSPPPLLLPPPPVLTSIDRARRQKELELLAQLDQGDEALADLWALWFQERGPQAAKKLFRAEELVGDGRRSWEAAELLLRELVDEHGVHWAEPVNRLATLYYLQGKLDQAERLCQTVLAVKPWHFGALSGIVLIYEGKRDAESARRWAARRLPMWTPSGPNRRRLTWVQQAVQNAEHSLADAERRVRTAFGAPDEHTHDVNRRLRLEGSHGDDDAEDAWQ